jgi:CRP-like cAMP-binding protein
VPLEKCAGGNRILAFLSEDDRRRLQPDLQPIKLPIRTQLERTNRAISRAYFLESGFASVVVNGTPERSIEIGMIGREGVTGLAVVMGTDRAPQETFMQSDGHGHAIAADALRRHMGESHSLRQCLLLFAHVFMVQSAQTCLSNGRSRLEERLARWLLMAHDRLGQDEMSLTQEFLATMLGVRRPGVTVAVALLEQHGLIRTRRGHIHIVDRVGLRKASNGGYGVPEAEFERLFA